MISTEQLLEFDQVKKIWKEYALTEAAQQQIDRTQILMSQTILTAQLRDTTEAVMMLEHIGIPPLVSLDGLHELLQIAQIGECLSALQLESVEKALVAIQRLKDYLNRSKQLELSIPYYEENLEVPKELQKQIVLQIRNGQVDDNASRQLKDIRAELHRAETKIKEKVEAVLRANKDCMSDQFTTVKNNHLCLPVKKECKFRISGSVFDKSSTGNTLFIEPTTAARYYEEIQTLKIDEDNEIRRILYELTVMVADSADVILSGMSMIEKLDFIFSKGKLSREMCAVEPAINTDRVIELQNARHPLMDKSICVPLQFRIGNGVNGIVITGPNTGGKTVSIKTVALNCMMAQCGLHVCCEKANICMNSNYLCDIGDGQNLSENLSTFSAHITNVLDILHQINKDSLVIMDELGSGTDPTEGMGIAVAILEELRKSKALFLVTTHYPEIKQYAAHTQGVVNARMTFNKENLQPMYQMIIGEAGESCAFYIASRLGMPASMIQVARKAAYGSEAEGQEDSPFKENALRSNTSSMLQKKRTNTVKDLSQKFKRGDSVMIYPDHKIGIVCEPINDKGVMRVQMPDKKIYINHKRVKLHVAATELYPDDYDFSIVFDSVEQRKMHHQMERKYEANQQVDIEQ